MELAAVELAAVELAAVAAAYRGASRAHSPAFAMLIAHFAEVEAALRSG